MIYLETRFVIVKITALSGSEKISLSSDEVLSLALLLFIIQSIVYLYLIVISSSSELRAIGGALTRWEGDPKSACSSGAQHGRIMYGLDLLHSSTIVNSLND
jgi:hypothetical protein